MGASRLPPAHWWSLRRIHDAEEYFYRRFGGAERGDLFGESPGGLGGPRPARCSCRCAALATRCREDGGAESSADSVVGEPGHGRVGASAGSAGGVLSDGDRQSNGGR